LLFKSIERYFKKTICKTKQQNRWQKAATVKKVLI